jgi:hypothetical protein
MDLSSFFGMVWGDQTGNVVIGQMNQAGPRGELDRSWDFKYPEQLDDLITFCLDRNGTDLYYSPLIYGEMRDKKTNRLRRIPENAVSSLVVYQDSDTCQPDNFLVRPSIHVTTSAGKYQDLWMLHEAVSADDAALMSRKIAVAHREDGSDPSSWSANKFLRIPGTTNTRHGFPEVVTAEAWGDVYDTSDIDAEYGDIDVAIYRPIARLLDNYVDSDQDLPDYRTAVDKIPQEQFSSLGIDRLVTEHPPEGKRSEMRYRMLCQLFRVNPPLDFEDILSIAWHAPAAAKWREDARNIRGLIMEAQKAQTDVGYEKGVGVSAAKPGELVVDIPRDDRPPVSLLTEAERESVGNINSFVKRYETWSMSKLGPAHNGPYARMNAWSVLSCAFADLGIIPSTHDSLNLYAMGIGDSGSGKTSARKLFDNVTQEIFQEDKGFYVGTAASPQAIHELLLERDGKTSMFLGDEAHGWFKTVNTQQWADGTYEDIALYYDGHVPPIHKTTKRELSGKSARCYFLVHLMGTMKGQLSITNVLTPAMFFSGFLPRFTWYLSDERVVTKETMGETNGDGEYISMGFEPMARQWAAEFANTKKQLRAKHKRRQVPMNMSQEALNRLTAFKWEARELAKARDEWELLEPCMIRLGPNVRRAASLLALEDGRDEVGMADLLLAIEQAEEWVSNLFLMAQKVSASLWARDTDEIENFILGKGGRSLYEVVMRRFAGRRTRDLMEQLTSLMAQGRLKEDNVKGRKYLVVNKGQEEDDG